MLRFNGWTNALNTKCFAGQDLLELEQDIRHNRRSIHLRCVGSDHADAVWHTVLRCSTTNNWTLMQIGSVKERSPILLATFAMKMPHRHNRMYMSPSNSPHINVVGESTTPMTLYGGCRPPLYRQGASRGYFGLFGLYSRRVPLWIASPSCQRRSSSQS